MLFKTLTILGWRGMNLFDPFLTCFLFYGIGFVMWANG